MSIVCGWLSRASRVGIGFGMILAALSTSALAGPQFGPEIDPGSMASALTLLTGGVLMLTERKRRS
jgi:hypothetical protein